ncbi:hypothetical protein C922_05623, partial [Plasmodium inui San Antonio 1]
MKIHTHPFYARNSSSGISIESTSYCSLNDTRGISIFHTKKYGSYHSTPGTIECSSRHSIPYITIIIFKRWSIEQVYAVYTI